MGQVTKIRTKNKHFILKNYKLYINGNWTDSETGTTDTILSPTTEGAGRMVQNACAKGAEGPEVGRPDIRASTTDSN
jgi:hypothetical protein